ncbi:MAG TPA: hypothetical protein VFV81_04030, partial [Verrucomicrobiae bacterium]|nr:hypothetical protein [Verrucomicrobiae bacterium]
MPGGEAAGSGATGEKLRQPAALKQDFDVIREASPARFARGNFYSPVEGVGVARARAPGAQSVPTDGFARARKIIFLRGGSPRRDAKNGVEKAGWANDQRIVHANPRSVHWLAAVEMVIYAKANPKSTRRIVFHEAVFESFVTVSSTSTPTP